MFSTVMELRGQNHPGMVFFPGALRQLNLTLQCITRFLSFQQKIELETKIGGTGAQNKSEQTPNTVEVA